MNQGWMMDQQYTSPVGMEPENEQQLGYFQINPPTPQQQHLNNIPADPHYTSRYPSFAGQPNGLQLQTHPPDSQTRSHYLRTHRSTSSIASHASQDSRLSFQTSLTGWSTTASPINSDPSTDFELGEDALSSLSLRRGVKAPNLALSVNPNVFRTKEKDSPSTASEDMRTAKPRAAARNQKSPKEKGGKGKGKDKKHSHARKSQQTPEHIPRPPNAFILFRKHVVDAKLIPPTVEMRHQNVSIIVARMWKEAPADQKAHFMQLAKKEKEEHMRKYPGYRYQPVYRRTNVIRRRVRKDDAEEEKCDTVAKLLLAGKTGKELEDKVKEETEATKAKKRALEASGASELSKGALRAMRARDRQSSAASEWSEFSRTNSEASGDIVGADIDNEDLEEDEDDGDPYRNQAGFQPMGLSMNGQQVMFAPEGMPWSAEEGYDGTVDFANPPPPELMIPFDMMYSQPQAYGTAYPVGTDQSVNSTFFDPAMPFSPTSGALLTRPSDSPFALNTPLPGMTMKGERAMSPVVGSFVVPMSARWHQDFGLPGHMAGDMGMQDHVMGGGFENLLGDDHREGEGRLREDEDRAAEEW